MVTVNTCTPSKLVHTDWTTSGSLSCLYTRLIGTECITFRRPGTDHSLDSKMKGIQSFAPHVWLSLTRSTHECIITKQHARLNPEDRAGKLPGPRSEPTAHRHIHEKPDPGHSPRFCGQGSLGSQLETGVLYCEPGFLALPDKLARIV